MSESLPRVCHFWKHHPICTRIILGLCIYAYSHFLTWESCEKSRAPGEKLSILVHHAAFQELKTVSHLCNVNKAICCHRITSKLTLKRFHKISRRQNYWIFSVHIVFGKICHSSNHTPFRHCTICRQCS